MARLFQMETLRTLVARALQGGEYAPGASARIRAVPDTRTIRYYTTLGLINPPAQMRGRTAYYDDAHVLQLVAIKQLQASGSTLAEVQRKLVGLPAAKLQAIAKLPSDFWDAADAYLAPLASRESEAENATEQDQSRRRESDAFWLAPAALPGSSSKANVDTKQTLSAQSTSHQRGSGLVKTAIRLALPGGVNMLVELPNDVQGSGALDIDALMIAAKPLIQELHRQRLIEG